MDDFKCHKCGCSEYFQSSGGLKVNGVFLDYDARGRYRFCAKCGVIEHEPIPQALDPDYIAKLHTRLDYPASDNDNK